MLFDSIVGACLLLFWAAAALACIAHRRRRNRPRRKRFGYYPSAAVLGNCLLALQAITQPSAGHVIEQKADEKAEDADTGDPGDPLEHFHRQAERIRRGNPPDRLTTWFRR